MDPTYLEGCEDKTDEDGKDPHTDIIYDYSWSPDPSQSVLT